MKILAIGDVVGKAGRKAVISRLPELKKRLKLDFIVVNGENASHGFGINRKICNALFTAGADVITMGNHTWDNKEIFSFIEEETRIIRPMNYLENSIGRGYNLYTLDDGRKVMVAQFLGNLFMEEYRNAFATAADWIKDFKLGEDINAIIVDFHAEATSEKMAFGHFLDGKVSLVFGTHTHIPTSDFMVLKSGTGYITDAGMTGDYDSVIGMEKTEPIFRFNNDFNTTGHLTPAEKEATLCGVVIETDDKTGLCLSIKQLKLGGILAQTDIL